MDHGQQIILILVGLIGSGKSTFAQALESHFPNFRRCNQDDLGNRRRVELLVRRSLEEGFSVCVDRTNIDESQRAHFVNISREFPNITVWTIVFDTPYEICASRIKTRTDHPTITTPELGLSVLERFARDYHPPTAEEGFDRIATLKPHVTGDYSRDEIAAILEDIGNMAPPASSVHSTPSGRMHFFRNEYGGGYSMHRGIGSGASPLSFSQELKNESWRRRGLPHSRRSWRNDSHIDSGSRRLSWQSGTLKTGADSTQWRPPRHQS